MLAHFDDKQYYFAPHGVRDVLPSLNPILTITIIFQHAGIMKVVIPNERTYEISVASTEEHFKYMYLTKPIYHKLHADLRLSLLDYTEYIKNKKYNDAMFIDVFKNLLKPVISRNIVKCTAYMSDGHGGDAEFVMQYVLANKDTTDDVIVIRIRNNVGIFIY